MTSRQFPVPNSTASFWRTELDEFDKHRSTPELPAEVDVVIIGAGYSGAALAYYIYQDNPTPPSVLILEAREACSGATARGHLKPDVYFGIPKHIKKHGAKAAVEVANFGASQVYAVKELVEKEKIDCDFTLTRACDATLDEGLARETEEAFKQLSASGVANLKDIHYTGRKDAERVSGVKGALGAFTFTAAHVWPYKLVMHLLKLSLARGANLQTYTPVTCISEHPLPDGRWLVTTKDRGVVRAKKVIFATNGYTANLAPQFRDHIVPVRGICSRIVVPPKEGAKGASISAAPFLPQTYSIRHGPGVYDYLIPRNDGSIIVGGAKSDFWSDTSQWYNVADDSKLIEPAKHYFDDLMQRTFMGWENSGAHVDKIWTGIMGYSSDWMPHVGDVPGKPGQMIMAGFSGFGMPLILLTAKGVVQMLREGKKFEDTGVPTLFKATQQRLDSTWSDILGREIEARPKL
ncbi:hypothetical protein G7054_g9244 [Neopestalotiopsis clavispora]|nr:hypothetical protein G7054_g9244 [Neopestalotiopsis clavispora]